MARAFIFPGQGSQEVGMGHALAQAFAPAREVLEEVDEALGQHLSRLMFEGPDEDLKLTENAQPALMAVSLAVMAVLRREGGMALPVVAECVAGHSLGEYSALAAAGAFDLASAAKLLRIRGRAMQDAVPVGAGVMAALIGADPQKARTIAEAAAADAGDVCTVANDNAPGQVVISGARSAVERAIEIASEQGVRRSVLLPVSAPFHCPLMAPAAKVMAQALAEATIEVPSVPVIANVTAEPVEAPDTIRRLLVEQVTGRVRWRESILGMKERGIDTVVEIGHGQVLCGLARRIDRELVAMPVGTPEEIEVFLKTL